MNEAWRYIKRTKTINCPSPPPASLLSHFVELLNGKTAAEPLVEEVRTTMHPQIIITQEDFLKHVFQLKKHKAPGTDQLMAEAITYADDHTKSEIKNILENCINGSLLPDTQNGFRANRSAIDNIFILNYCAQRTLAEKNISTVHLLILKQPLTQSIGRNSCSA